ncbi:MAG: acetate--CoA ligase family protein [Candidatus Krumholzibacteriota bacterium]|nr:acetate--CoA ligase family protein [Candidatus Krumholzibacteriota bacterium]
MLIQKIKPILERSKKAGWITEPDAMEILRVGGLDTTESTMAVNEEEAVAFAEKHGYPVVAKVVSPEIIHKSDVGGVVVGIDSEKKLRATFKRLSLLPGFTGAVVAEMARGIELIIGAKVDSQFGPVILLGIGGVGVEIYKDTAVRMAPLNEEDVSSMIAGIKGQQLIRGFRGSDPVDIGALTTLMIEFSDIVMELESYIDSVDLNPVICSGSRCVIADARMILKEKG